jgi:hypothetical protein
MQTPTRPPSLGGDGHHPTPATARKQSGIYRRASVWVIARFTMP